MYDIKTLEHITSLTWSIRVRIDCGQEPITIGYRMARALPVVLICESWTPLMNTLILRGSVTIARCTQVWYGREAWGDGVKGRG